MNVKRILIRSIAFVLVATMLAGTWAWLRGPRYTPEELFQQGLLAVQKEDWPGVRQFAQELKRYPDFSNNQLLFEAIYLLKSGSPATAIKVFQRVKAVGAVREPALLYGGEACYQLDHILDAELLFAMLAADNPGHAEAHRWLAGIAHDLGDMNRARNELEVLIRLKPTDYRPHMLLGQMYLDQERYGNAVECYTRARALHPPESALEEFLPQLADAQIQLREYAAARETLSQAPPSARVSALEAECLWSLDDEAGAREKLADALERDPYQTHALYLLGRLELDAGHPEAALEPLRRVMKLDPMHSESQHQLAQALRLTGNQSEADAVAKQAAQATEMRGQLAVLHLESFNHPEDPEIRERMAALCDKLGRPQLSEVFRKAAAVCRQRLSAQQQLHDKGQIPSVP